MHCKSAGGQPRQHSGRSRFAKVVPLDTFACGMEVIRLLHDHGVVLEAWQA